MEGYRCTITTFMALLLVSTHMSISSNALITNTMNKQFIQNSCKRTTYPQLCCTSLYSHSSKIKTNYQKLTYTALSISLKGAKSTAKMVSNLAKQPNLKPNEKAALKDCVENISDSVYEISQSVKEMKNLNGTQWDYKMDNIKTWVSASLSDEDTCLDGLNEEVVNQKMKDTIRKNVQSVAQLTSNALVFLSGLKYSKH